MIVLNSFFLLQNWNTVIQNPFFIFYWFSFKIKKWNKKKRNLSICHSYVTSLINYESVQKVSLHYMFSFFLHLLIDLCLLNPRSDISFFVSHFPGNIKWFYVKPEIFWYFVNPSSLLHICHAMDKAGPDCFSIKPKMGHLYSGHTI